MRMSLCLGVPHSRDVKRLCVLFGAWEGGTMRVVTVLALWMGLLMAGEKTPEEIVKENDALFQEKARKHLAEKSMPEADAAWKRKIKDQVEQKGKDGGFDENAALNQLILDWGCSKDFAKLSEKELTEAARFYLAYRDRKWSPFDVGNLQFPERLLKLLKEQKIDERFGFQRGVDQAQK